MQDFWVRSWYEGRRWLCLLRPLSALFQWLATRRRKRLQAAQADLPLPVVVIGNISLGGTGKTPLLITLARDLCRQGWKPAIVSRGYGGNSEQYPLFLAADTPVTASGDEPALLMGETGLTVVVDPLRLRAVQAIAAQTDCDLILSDDGLQHYGLPRTVEICVVDGERGLGNGRCLPEGPLREPPERLTEVDLVVSNGMLRRPLGHIEPAVMTVAPVCWRKVSDPMHRANLDDFPWRQDESVSEAIAAVTGIGNPSRFAGTLADLGLTVEMQTFPDHHQFTSQDLAQYQHQPLLMTAKDAVKCRSFAGEHWWYLAVEAKIPDSVLQQVAAKLSATKRSTVEPSASI